MMENYLIFMLTSQPNEKSVVHCSAGIGRTGTTITIMNIIINLFAQKNAGIQDPEFSVFSVVRRIRECRYGMVQVQAQYEFIY
jgi:protein tyrosine phosphatase